ncbi:DNA-3-methyladenine glycosylase [Chitinophaga sedimenti]|uniref:DNA-3-methyladenine glycosylase n=1 Tax=Chitinophaga sedimenti TaxID=2033606 RepID=UPI0020060A79|nr:DNA-3-methyladenine glycosylase [Chitinophaga sedimenti]MCK7557900.1 DNA-3-methyladenine glycosylase [Chitinophaga sedimenti]
MDKVAREFYEQQDVCKIAKSLLGKILVTQFNNMRTSGVIVETEAYAGVKDKASHAFGGRRTARTEIMYAPGGLAYVYLCYGIHHLFNVVTNHRDVPHAVLVRALQPLEGIDVMLERCKKTKLDYTLTGGPGSLTKALGIHTSHTGTDLTGNEIWIEEGKTKVPATQIVAGTRVGVAYAKEDALLPYRFSLKNNPWVSRGKGLNALPL